MTNAEKSSRKGGQQRMTWISCKNPPNIGENVIATDGNKSFAAWYTGESWEDKEDRLVGRVIAWMPFPEFMLEGGTNEPDDCLFY